MSKSETKNDSPLDVLVLGEHPASYLAAALLAHQQISVVHSIIPGEISDPSRLVLVNPELFELHPILNPLRRKLELHAIYGIQFLDDDPALRSEFRSKSALSYITTYKALRTAIMKLAQDQGVSLLTPKQLQIHRLDERGAEVTAGKLALRPKALMVAGTLPVAEQKLLGLPESWGADVLHRYTYIKLPTPRWADLGARAVLPMSLNLRDMFCWGWLLPGERCVQLAVEQPIETISSARPADLLAHWAKTLRSHGILTGKGDLPLEDAQSMDLPLAGALAHEGLANRTMLIGPAGGFYSACSEDIYPNCWSALFAVDAVKAALKERHLQDALQPYRHKWRTTLGDYLRGPQQNLRFLLPLVYRKQVMTTRLTESILLGKSVVR